MLFSKKTENGMDYDCLGDTAARSANGLVPFNPGSQSLNVNGEVLRQRAGTAARSVIDAWLTMKGNLESEGDIQVDGKVPAEIRRSDHNQTATWLTRSVAKRNSGEEDKNEKKSADAG